jgi:hypothetical protein
MGTSPPPPVTGVALRQGLGNQDGVNVLQLAGVKVFLRLCFTDPEGTKRFFPRELPVRVQFSGGGTARTSNCTLGDNGRLTFLARGAAAEAWREFTLLFPANGANPRYCVYEVRGASPSPPGSPPAVPRIADALPNTQERLFRMPPDFAAGPWGLAHSDWAAGTGANAFPGHATFTANTGIVRHNQDPPLDIGTVDVPVELILNPHWKYFRFEFFDRYWGPAPLNPSPPRASHGARISIPPVLVEGFRGHPNATDADPVDAASNWTLDDGANRLLQCLPWIVRKEHGGAALPAQTGANTGLRFKTPANSYVFSSSDTAREIIQVPPGSPPNARLDPGIERLKHYRLPEMWKSRMYFAQTATSPPTTGAFFQTLNAGQLNAADNRGTPIIFCLDDIVLTDAARAPIALAAQDRVAVYHHRFSPGAGLSNEGLYSANGNAHTAGNAEETHGFPYSDVEILEPTGGSRCYLHDYPDWTRLVISQGNLFDAFDERMPDVNNRVVGARAAIRWVDATSTGIGVAAGNALSPRPALTNQPFFHVQPFYEQQFISSSDNPQPGAIQHIEWNNAYPGALGGAALSPPPPAGAARSTIGRFDIVHLRCSDHDGVNEVASLLLYHRVNIEWAGSPMAASPAADQRNWVRRFIEHIMERWNSPDPNGCNPARALIVPRPVSPPGPTTPRTQVITLLQYLTTARSHFFTRPVPAAGGSWMAGGNGTGRLRVNAIDHDAANRGLASAHEYGHCVSLPDDYRPGMTWSRAYRWNDVPGNPYDTDDDWQAQALMKYNWLIRSRYFWFVAEWLRTLPGLGNLELQIEHGADGPYWLPHYQHAGFPGRNYLYWPVSFNLRQGVTYDAFLFMMGADLFSTAVLPGRLPGGASPPPPPASPRIDGTLMVLLRMWIDMTAVPGSSANIHQRLYNLVVPLITPLNNQRTARFQVLAGPDPVPRFNRCLIHFLPCFLSAQEPNAGVWDPSAAVINARTPHHLAVRIDPAVAAVARNAAATPATLDLPCPANFNTLSVADQNIRLNAWADEIATSAFQTLGLSRNANPAVANSFMAPASYVRFVRAVMDGAAPNPTVV